MERGKNDTNTIEDLEVRGICSRSRETYFWKEIPDCPTDNTSLTDD